MAVEQHMRHARRFGAGIMCYDHGMAGRRDDAGVEAEVPQLGSTPVGGLLAARLVGRVGGDAFYAQQLEQPRQRCIALRGQRV